MRTETLEIACYGLCVGLFGLLVWEGWQTRTAKWRDGPTTKKGWSDLREGLQKEGEARQPDDAQWKYTARYTNWWSIIEVANLTGKLPPKPTNGPGNDRPKPPPGPKTLKPLGDIIELRLISANGIDANWVKVRYKDSNVQVPSSVYAAIPAVAATAGPMIAGAAIGPYHDLTAGASLYPPYDDVKFKGVDIAEEAAIFTRAAPEGEGKTVTEKLTLSELGLGEDHFDAGIFAALDASRATGTSRSSKEKPWSDPGAKTKMVKQNLWMISEKDSDAVARDYERLLTEEFRMEDWQDRRPDKKTGKRRRGVAVRTVSPEMARFGVKQGDVLIKVNGQKVTSRATAIKVGKTQYQRGVRTFELTFLSAGREVVRTYRAPDNQ